MSGKVKTVFNHKGHLVELYVSVSVDIDGELFNPGYEFHSVKDAKAAAIKRVNELLAGENAQVET